MAFGLPLVQGGDQGGDSIVKRSKGAIWLHGFNHQRNAVGGLQVHGAGFGILQGCAHKPHIGTR